MSGIEVIIEDVSSHPQCPHGPTLFFSRNINGQKRKFYACAACRDRKDCSFFMYEEEKNKFTSFKEEIWRKEKEKLLKNINHRKMFLNLNEVQKLSEDERIFCHTCRRFEFDKFLSKHKDHKLDTSITNYQLAHPTEFLPPLEDPKKEAQFLFSKNSVKTLVDILKQLNYTNIICMGTPRIHEFIQNENTSMASILLDIDQRYHNFYGPLQFCWHNSFNNHFFFDEAKEIFEDFLHSSGFEKTVLILDPPFGGRVEPLAHTLKAINERFKALNKCQIDLPIFWIFPYFMEPQILNSLPEFQMLDYKVDYDNHPLFQDGPKGRKQGSPVRIFTNVDPSIIKLPEEEGYHYCDSCRKWVAQENQHCKLCNKCTSKDGRTYIHCNDCKRCVKPTWKHCEVCKRCAQQDHKCGQLEFSQECFHCKQPGHKKRDCPQVNQDALQKKRKIKVKTASACKKKKKQK